MYTSYNAANRSSLSFTGVEFYSGAYDTLKKVIKPKQMKDFKKIINSLENNSIETIFLCRNGNSKKLDAKVISPHEYIYTRNYSQWFFESTMHFLKRICKKADIMREQVMAMRIVEDGFNKLSRK